jgi:MSHA pilin protein MshD
MVRKQTIAIAESLLEEILLKEFANPAGGDTGTSRKLFDDVSQYSGYSTPVCTVCTPPTTATPPGCGVVDMLGDQVKSLCAYNISSVAIDPAATLGTQTVKKVTVSVTGPQGVVTLTGYRGNY